jgi:hypothetical protein
MFTVTYEHILGFLIVVVSFLAGRLAYKIYKDISFKLKNNKKFKEKKKAIDEMKANGDFHKWMDLSVGTKIIRVCEKTGYAPEIDGFIDMFLINIQKEKNKMEEEYQEFKTQRTLELAEEYGLTVDKMEELQDKVFSIKKDFTVGRMDKFLAELRAKSEEI